MPMLAGDIASRCARVNIERAKMRRYACAQIEDGDARRVGSVERAAMMMRRARPLVWGGGVVLPARKYHAAVARATLRLMSFSFMMTFIYVMWGNG